MGRPRAFDEDEVIECALATFREKGYEATSVSDLMAATGLAKSSVYKGFGDKRSLFLRTLDTYLSRGRARYQGLDDPKRGAVDVLRDWLLFDVQRGAPQPSCFAVKIAIELADRDEEVRDLLQAHHRQLEDMFQATLRRGQVEGSVRKGLNLKRTARWISTVVAGLQVSARTGLSQAEVKDFVEFSLASVKR